MKTITIQEKSCNEQGEYEAAITFDHEGEVCCTFAEPFSATQTSDLEWYFGEYANNAEDDDKAAQIAARIEDYGKQLFKQLFVENPQALMQYYKAKAQPGESLCLEISGSPTFHTLHWETLHDPDETQPLTLNIPIVRKYREPTTLEIPETAIIHLLIVTARPFGEHDINYRHLSRPVVDSLRQVDDSQLRVQIDLLRPGTYRALAEHLAKQPNGYYQIIHFDVHGALLTHAQLQQGVDNGRYVFENSQTFQDKLSFLFLETGQDNQAEPVPAERLAHLLRACHIPMVILNACESGKQVGMTETSLSGQFMQAGLLMVLAMRYTVTASAAILLMPAFYENLFAQQEVATAIRLARAKLYQNKLRRDGFNQRIALEDWIIPVVYQNKTVRLPIRDFNPDEKRAYYAQTPHRNPTPPYQFLGRDWEVRDIESHLRTRNLLLIHGGSGIGKTALLHHLGQWWQNTGLINKVFYLSGVQATSTLFAKRTTETKILAWILETIAEQLFEAADKSTFEQLPVKNQQSMVAKRLCSQPHLLIVDALQYLTEPEKAAWHDFLVDLVNGKTLVLLESQSDEKWLATGTFENNVYQLAGLDNQSAFTLITSTLERHHIQDDSDDIRALPRQLEGHPLLLEIVTRANFTNQDAMLAALQPEITRTDIQGEAKQQSILHAAINYIYKTLSSDEQGLLLCLAPFKFSVNRETLPEYSQRLRQHPVLAQLAFDNWEKVLQKMVDWGLLRLYPNVLLQSAFAEFLRRRLLAEKAQWQDAIETAFGQYFDKLLKVDSVTQVERSTQKAVQTATPNKGDTPLVLSGKIKIKLCQRLGATWQDLADQVGIKPHERRLFMPGRECQAIWEWLEERNRLHELKEALNVLERTDLVELLDANSGIYEN
jgi:hypothetical protein